MSAILEIPLKELRNSCLWAILTTSRNLLITTLIKTSSWQMIERRWCHPALPFSRLALMITYSALLCSMGHGLERSQRRLRSSRTAMILWTKESESIDLVKFLWSSWSQFCYITAGLKRPKIRSQRFGYCITPMYASWQSPFGSQGMRQRVLSSIWII